MILCDLPRCLACVFDPRCSEFNIVIDKHAALMIMERAVRRMSEGRATGRDV
jgi:putative component of membrane protein insertase Oxa1/YidC/SpoIIIJ protein YidD